MAVFAVPSAWQSVVAGASLYALYYVYWQLKTGAARRAFAHKHGCQPVPTVCRWYDPLGLQRTWSQFSKIRHRRVLESGADLFKQADSKTVLLPRFGRTVVLTCDSVNVRSVLAVDFANWGVEKMRQITMGQLLGAGVFTTDGPAWQHSREMLRPNFARAQVADLSSFEEHIQHLLQQIPKDGSTVDLQPLFHSMTMDSATEFLFGQSTNTLKSADVSTQAFCDAFDRAQIRTGNFMRLGLLAFLLPDFNAKSDLAVCHGFVDKLVDDVYLQLQARKGEPRKRYVFADELAGRTQDRKRVRSELLQILLAGRDSTASVLTNVFFLVAQRPDVEARLRKELADLDLASGRLPSWDDLRDCKFLRAVLNETLRLYPIVPINARMALRDTVLPHGGGPDGTAPAFVPQGGLFLYNTYTMHRSTDLWGADANEFKPERWLGPEGIRPGWDYLPFSGGPRICLGPWEGNVLVLTTAEQFALTEASYTVIRLLQEFDRVEQRDHGPWVESLALTCKSANGCKIGLYARES